MKRCPGSLGVSGRWRTSYDFQGISDDAELARISAKLGIKPAGKVSGR
jgi:hypothetical protein